MRHWSKRIPYLAEFAQTHDVLHIGVGRQQGFGVTLDISPSVEPDILADLSKPLDIDDNSFDAVYAFSILEHIVDLVGVTREMHRIIRPGGLLAVLAPHFSAAAVHVDPTHVRGFSARTFDYFVDGSDLQKEFDWYSDARFSIAVRHTMLQSRVANRIAGILINRHIDMYEEHFAYILRGAGVYWELKVEK